MLKAIIFDLDGTIISEDYPLVPLKSIHSSYFKGVSWQDFKKVNNTTLKNLISLHDTGDIMYHQIGLRIWFDMLSSLRLDIKPSRVFEIHEKFQKYVLGDLKINSGIIEAIKFIRLKGMKVGILSNGAFHEKYQKVKKIQIWKEIDCLVSSDIFGIEKPDPRIFKKTLELLSVSSDKALYVGNNFSEDVEGAYSAGIVPVWYNPLNKEIKSKNIQKLIQINDFSNLPNVIRSFC